MPRNPPQAKPPSDAPFLTARPVPARASAPIPTAEEFAAWTQHPVSEWVAAVFEAKAEECQRTWAEQSWSAREPSQALLIELRTRADNFRAFLDSTYEDYRLASPKK